MSPFDIAAVVGAVAVAATRLLKSAAPLWAKLPKPVAAALPVLVAALPQVADMAGVVKSEIDLVNFGVLALALLVPGVEAAVVDASKK